MRWGWLSREERRDSAGTAFDDTISLLPKGQVDKKQIPEPNTQPPVFAVENISVRPPIARVVAGCQSIYILVEHSASPKEFCLWLACSI
jgi:hypothetical protein